LSSDLAYNCGKEVLTLSSGGYKSSAYVEDIEDIAITLQRYPIAIEVIEELGGMNLYKQKIGLLPTVQADSNPEPANCYNYRDIQSS
jgi:hypothetical protein